MAFGPEVQLRMIEKEEKPPFNWQRINPAHPFDVFLPRVQLEEMNKVVITPPLLPLGNGIHGIVYKGTFSGTPCALRFEGLTGDICDSRKDPWVSVDREPSWRAASAGLKKAEAGGYGPRLYTDFRLHGRLVGARPANAKYEKSIIVGTNAVELMKATLWKYAGPGAECEHNELTQDDFNQYCNLLIKMQIAYAATYPFMPRDLHANNSMYKLEGGKRVWLYTDIDESYMKTPVYETPYQLVAETLEIDLQYDHAKIARLGATAPAASKTRQGTTVSAKPVQIGKTVRGAPKPKAAALPVVPVVIPPPPARPAPPPPRVRSSPKFVDALGPPQKRSGEGEFSNPGKIPKAKTPPKPVTPKAKTPPKQKRVTPKKPASKRVTRKPAATRRVNKSVPPIKTLAKMTVRKPAPRGLEANRKRQLARVGDPSMQL
jgi:hypothetical protein